MYKLLAVINGMFIAIMIILNGLLADKTSVVISLAAVNILGLIMISLIIFIKKIKLRSIRHIPFYLLFTGIISLLNVGFNNISFIHLGATLTIGLVLYGQLIASALVDHFGILGMEKRPFNKKKIVGLMIISSGILIMILY